ncbi:MAG: hypothetical protein EPO28_17525 [Saprospiraceae bacterium]|nr:MAG: hypothetical protein EPO28_17525 [Saprospiraceae bacterium]
MSNGQNLAFKSITGVYFHRDADAYYLNKSRTDIYNDYGVNKSNTINVFFTPHGDWSGVANAIGGSVKHIFINDYFTYVKPTCQEWSIRYSASILNHEIGHTLSLKHTWNEDDICDDTPRGFVYDRWHDEDGNGVWQCDFNQNANCWEYNDNIPTCPASTGGKPCDTWLKTSNNLMDYNKYDPHAVTVCQIERMNSDLAGGGNMFIHSCNGCMPSIAFFDVPQTYRLCPLLNPSGGLFLNGKASFNENKWLIDICEVDPAFPNDCVGNNINTGWQTGEIGKVNLFDFYSFQVNKYYRIKLMVDNTDCPPSSEYTRIVQILPCSPEPPTGSPVDLAGTNPFANQLTVYYTVNETGRLLLRLVNIMTGGIIELLPESDVLIGEYQLIQSTDALSSGSYSLQAIFNGNIYSETIIKP